MKKIEIESENRILVDGESHSKKINRYNDLKYAFLNYRGVDDKQSIIEPKMFKCNGGVAFVIDKKIIAKMNLAYGYVRVFLALNPTLVDKNRYHHRNCSKDIEFKMQPLMVKVGNKKQYLLALELIEQLMTSHGLVKRCYPSTVLPKNEYNLEGIENSKLPYRAVIVNKRREKIGTIKKCIWSDNDKRIIGEFIRDENKVFYFADGIIVGYVDRNNNIFDEKDNYCGTIVYKKILLIPIFVLLLCFITLLSALLAMYLTKSSRDYVPTLFITDQGSSWEEYESIPVFYNKKFNDEIIEPGLKGSYAFKFENVNPNALVYNMTFLCVNEYNINLLYRIKRDGAYVAGYEDYVSIDNINCYGLTIESSSTSIFEIEWYWKDNDDIDTVAGENAAKYNLKISLTAWVRGND